MVESVHSHVLRCFCLWQRSQVTSMFGAGDLWAKGYTGAKVKMAIFDTGIRADHPHFRNIKVMVDLEWLFLVDVDKLNDEELYRSAQIGQMKIR